MKKKFSHLLVLFFQFHIKLTNRKSALRNSDKQKSTISNKLTAETLHTHTADTDSNEDLEKMELTVTRLEQVLAKLSEISDEFFGGTNDHGQRGSKMSQTTVNEYSANYTNMFNNATILSTFPRPTNRIPIVFIIVGIVVVAGFLLIFYMGHNRSSV